jgi:hypothetical protein
MSGTKRIGAVQRPGQPPTTRLASEIAQESLNGEKIRVVATFPDRPNNSVYLWPGNEWVDFEEEMTGLFGSDNWSAEFDGQHWCSQKRTPKKEQTIKVSFKLPGRGKMGKTVLNIGLPKCEPKPTPIRNKCMWEDFSKKVSGELGHDAWEAKINGELWTGDDRRPRSMETIWVRDLSTPESTTPPPDELPETPERITRYPPPSPEDHDDPVSLEYALSVAIPPHGWRLTPVEASTNEGVLAVLESISDWNSLAFASTLLKNTIAEAQKEKRRDRPNSISWQRSNADMTVKDLLPQLPICLWPVPRDNGCFYPFCEFCLMATRNSHLQHAHARQRDPEGNNKTKGPIWNGESTLSACTADLLNIRAIAPSSTKYSNPYCFGDSADGKVSSFKALSYTWDTAELKLWHNKLGTFRGPIVKHMQVSKRWMPLREPFNTGYPHQFQAKISDLQEEWRRPSANP